MPRTASLGFVAALVLAGTSAAAAQSVTELYVTPDTIRLAAGGRQVLAIQAFDDAGNAVLKFAFRSSDTTIATVAPNGTVSAGSRGGRARITVQAGNKTQEIPVIVAGPAAAATAASAPAPKPAAPRPAPRPAAKPTVARLLADPASLTLFPGQTTPIQVRAFDAAGNVVEAPELVWRSLQPDLFLVDGETGEVTARAAGQGVVQVIGGAGATVTVPVTVATAEYRLSAERLVLAPEQRETLVATLPLQGNRPVPMGLLQWTVADPGVVSVDANGEVVALAPGSTEVVIRGFQQERRIPVVVHGKVSHFLVSPRINEPVRLMLQAKREFTAIPQTADSIPIAGVPATWGLSDSTVASFDTATGVLTARKGGSTTLSYTARGFQPKTWNIEVLPGDVQLTTTRASLRPAQGLQLAASFVDPRGNVLSPASGLSWVTSDATVAKVSPTGVLEGVAPGRAQISASVPGGKPSTMTVFVTGDLLVAMSRSGGSLGVYALVTASPEQFHPVVADTGNNRDASYSPDRTRLVFASDRGGSLDLYVADADGRNPVRLTTDPAPESEPAWSPDGQRIVFAATRAGSRQLYVISVNGGEARQLTSLAGGATAPVVSPDGRTVAFAGALSTSRDAPTDIYTIPLSGGAPTPVTQTKERRETTPAYLPDGTLAWLQFRRDKKDPDQVVQQPKIGGVSATLLATPLPLQAMALSPDGQRIAWIVNRTAENSKAAPEFTLQWRPLSGGAETTVRLQPGERITSPAF